MRPLLGWALAALLASFSWQAYGLRGLALAATAIVFWLLLQFNRAVRTMKNAAGRPLGHVESAVMFQAQLKPGLTMLEIVGRTKSLGRKAGAGEDDWSWRDDGGNAVHLHFERGRLARWTLERPSPGTAATQQAAEILLERCVQNRRS